MVDLIEKIIKAIKEQQVSLSIIIEVSSILLEYSQPKGNIQFVKLEYVMNFCSRLKTINYIKN